MVLHPALWDLNIQREVLRFLRKRGQDIRGGNLDRLTNAILEGPPRDLFRHNLTVEQWNKIRDKEILLRLHKILESGVTLPVLAQEVYGRIQQDWPWQPPGDRSEEFSFFISYGRGFDVDQKDTNAPKNFTDMSAEQFIQWSETQTSEPWKPDGGWFGFVKCNIKASVILLTGAAENNAWPIAPWDMTLGAYIWPGEGNAAIGMEQELAALLIRMPPENLAELDLQAARWVEATWKKLEQEQRRKLWEQIWNASLLNDDPPDDLDFDSTLNCAGGVLGKVLYNELTLFLPRVSAEESPGLPIRFRPYFEKIEAEHTSAKLARVRIVPMLVFLFRVDRDWTKRTFFHRMNPDDEASFDRYLWEAYFRFGRWSADLLKEFKPLMLRTLCNDGAISEDARVSGIAMFIHMAVPSDRWIALSEAKTVLWNADVVGLSAAAESVGDMLRGAGDKSSALWRETIQPWFEKVWPNRPRDRSRDLSTKLAEMSMDSGSAFPYVINSIKNCLTAEKWNAALFRLNESGLSSRYPREALILIDKIFDGDGNGDRSLLRKVLDAISEAEPDLQENRSFKRLGQWADANRD